MNNNQVKNLRNASLLAFVFVALLVGVNLITTNNYGRSNNEVVELLQQNEYILNYHQLKSIAEGTTERYLLIDLRDETEYQQGHLPTALNIPLSELFLKSNLEMIESGKVPVLYGSKEATAQTARLLLLAKGVDANVMVLGGNYETAMKYGIENFDEGYVYFRDEKARFDYNRYINTGSSEKKSNPSGVIPQSTVTTANVKGGC